MIALDLVTGKPCADFGTNGEVKVDAGMELNWPGEFQITSAPVVVRRRGDRWLLDRRQFAGRRAARDGARLRCAHGAEMVMGSGDARCRGSGHGEGWGEGYKDVGHAQRLGAHDRSTRSAGYVFLPTSSPSPDFFGGLRPGDNAYANSVVALKAETGELALVVPDGASRCLGLRRAGAADVARRSMWAARSAMSLFSRPNAPVFVLDRDTGVPVYPVEERPMPQGGVAGEVLVADAALSHSYSGTGAAED